MTDSKYVTAHKERETFELRLNNEKKGEKRGCEESAARIVGKDVRSLFPDTVVNCVLTDTLQLKELLYLHLQNHAKSQPARAVMAVDSFVKACEDPSPLIRALAVRTTGCIQVGKITECLCEALRKCLQDEDPYVRKTAAVCWQSSMILMPKWWRIRDFWILCGIS
ncbi:hypothetical protein HJG60_009334 [Phyllostomus discolor]|uniref:Clathrin/coatomer adaptor adaptin-like N-terminal domain-containing protein n=1 Tax=Phyllostomus discolor TaxID=89673 RepID=A0A833YIB1_9CHIR|nr:hypothetical protein HJG60_009334 [Phyllostomus discolor]